MTAFVVPPRGEEEKYAQLLLELAGERVHEVQTTMDGPHGVAFHVPEALADAFNEALHSKKDEDSEESEDSEDAGEDGDDASEPEKPKRRGRPAGSKNKPKETPAEDSSEDKE